MANTKKYGGVNMSDKMDFINEIVAMMKNEIEFSTAHKLKNIMISVFADYDITKISRELTIYEDEKTESIIKKFLVEKMIIGRSERTIKSYRKNLNKILLQDIKKPINQITEDDLFIYLSKRELQDKVSKFTQKTEMRICSTFFQWCFENKLTLENPAVNVRQIKLPKQKKYAFTEMDLEKMRSICKDEKKILIFEILLSTWCRVSEVTNIKISDIKGETITVLGKGNKERLVYLNARTILALENYLKKRKDDNPYLFPKLLSCTIVPGRTNWKNPNHVEQDGHTDQASIEQIVRKIGIKAGVEKAHPHRFRRTGATMALKRGMPIQHVSNLLGHESLDTTKIYLDISEEDTKQAHMKYV